jgi:hypothetical protein
VNHALWLLIGLQLRGWLRYLGRNLRTVKGATLALVGFSVCLFYVLLLVLARTQSGVSPEKLRMFGPAGLVMYCLLNVLLSSGDRTIYFTPAEVNFLFTGPYSRREVLGYKIVSTLLIGLPTVLLMAAFLRGYAEWFLAAFVGLILVYVFMQLFTMALSLLATSVGARMFTRGRRLVLAAVVVGAAALLVPSAAVEPGSSPQQIVERLANVPAWQVLTRPLGWFFDAFLATNYYDLAVSAALALLVDLALLAVVLGLDAYYLESAAAASARVYARIQRMRRAGLAGDAPSAGGKVRLSLPAFPWWGGIGPTVWRQMTTAMRGMVRLLTIMGILVGIMGVPLLSGPHEDGEAVAKLGSVLLWLTIFLTALVPFDFRGDLERLALLKTLPVPAWRLAVGQLLTPVLLVTLLHWLVLAAALPFTPESGPWLAGLAAFALPFNFLLFALENLLFLLFPTRLTANTPGDFQALGRSILFLAAKVLGLVIVSLFAAMVGGLVGWLTHSIVLGAAAAWPVVALSGAALVPLIALAFRAFDVGRDMPA